MKFKIVVSLALAALMAGALSAAPAGKKSKKGSAKGGSSKVVNITEGWYCQPIEVDAKKQNKNVCPPAKEDEKKKDDLDSLMNDDDLLGGGNDYSAKKGKESRGVVYTGKDGQATVWMPKPVDLTGLVPLTKKFINAQEPQSGKNATYNTWYKKMVKIPEEWEGKCIALEQDIGYIDLVVFIGGKQVGVMQPPRGFLDVSAALKGYYGKEVEFRIFATNRGYGTGTGGIRYQGRDDIYKTSHFKSPMNLRVHTPAILEDTWMDTSVRKKELRVQHTVYSFGEQTVEIAANIVNDEGRAESKDPNKPGMLLGEDTVKEVTKSFKLTNGVNVVSVTVPWTDFTVWEPNRPFLYNCEVTMTTDDGKKCEAPPKFIFAFREVWRDKGQVILNGHVQSVRGWWCGETFGLKPGETTVDGLKRAGFNALYATHQHESYYIPDQKQMEECARKGFLFWGGAPAISCCRNAASDPVTRKQYARFCEVWARGVRNWPSFVGASVGVNMMCAAWWTMGANDMGKGNDGKSDIFKACEFVKTFHPNCLAFAHGDGNICDAGCSNFYFNFTPLQEREEWYSSWYDRRNDERTIPYYPAEYGQPYYGSWSGGGQPSMTEFCAIYYGLDAYRAESPRMLELSRDFAYSKAELYYGCYAPGDKEGESFKLYAFNPLGRELYKMFAIRVGRAWRAWHCRLGAMYLDELDVSSDTNATFSAQAACNGDLVCFIGGKPDEGKQRFTDRTHAYYGGTEAVKSLVMVWDGLGAEKISAKWKLVEKASGKTLASGTVEKTLNTGDVLWEPVSVKLPVVTAKTPCAFEVTFDSPHMNPFCRKDSFPLEIHPAFAKGKAPAGATMAIYDPKGDSARALDALGYAVTKVDSLEALAASEATHLVIGRRALDGLLTKDEAEAAKTAVPLAKFAALVENGKRVMILNQNGDVWRKMGFEPEDTAPRQMFNCALPSVEDDDLAYWAGSPLPIRESSEWHWGPDWGPSQNWHRGGRGWRWTHTHALSLCALLVPQRTLFRPLVKGEFDMSYSTLMRAVVGKGALTVCTLDFEGRTGATGCAAANKVMKAAFDGYLADKETSAGRVFTDGADAARLAETLGFEPSPYEQGKALGAGDVLLCGNDAELDYEGVEKAVSKGGFAMVVGNDDLAKEAGFKPHHSMKTVIKWSTRVIEFAEDEARKIKRAKANVSDDLELAGDDLMGLDEEKPKEKKKPRRPKGVAYADLPRESYATTNTVVAPVVRTQDTAKFGAFPYAGVDLPLLRWRESPRPNVLDEQAGWTTAGDGLFAIRKDGRILFDQIQPFRVLDERTKGGAGGKGDGVGKANYSISLNNNLRRHSLVLENKGVKPNPALLERIFSLKGGKDIMWSACGYDPYGYVYW